MRNVSTDYFLHILNLNMIISIFKVVSTIQISFGIKVGFFYKGNIFMIFLFIKS